MPLHPAPLWGVSVILTVRDVTRLGLGGAQASPNDVAAPPNGDGNKSFYTAVLDIMLL